MFFPSRAEDFICDQCCAHRREKYGEDGGIAHVYTHPLVRVKPVMSNSPEFIPQSPVQEIPTERRLASLEDRITAMDTKFDQLQEQMSVLESQIRAHLDASRPSTQQILLDKIAELTSALQATKESQKANGHAE